MSTQHPGGSRRRRIAGERRGRTTDPVHPADPTALVDPSPQVVDPAPKVVEPSPKVVDPSPKAIEPSPKVVDPPPPVKKPVRTPASEPDVAPDPRPAGWWGSRASLLLLSGLLVLLLALAGLAALGALGTDGVGDLRNAEAVDRATTTAPGAAEAAAAAILAYDHESLEADKDAAVRFMTDDFAEEYSETFEKVVAPTAEDTGAKVTASVLASGVVRATEDTARVVLFVDQATVSEGSERPRIALNRVVMTMVREGDRWLVDDVSPY